MATPTVVRQAQGSWRGRSRLNLPWLPEDKRITESASTLQVIDGLDSSFGTVSYTWEYEGVPQAGTLIFAGAKDPEGDRVSGLTGAWADSWHQSASIMTLAEIPNGTETIRLQGSYPAEEGPDWGWRLELELVSPEALEFRMVNILPDGTEMWAQHGTYHRA